jgi:hypothetical protein
VECREIELVFGLRIAQLLEKSDKFLLSYTLSDSMSRYDDEAAHELGEGRSYLGADLEMPLAIAVRAECERAGERVGGHPRQIRKLS